jgi:hypothetical protein
MLAALRQSLSRLIGRLPTALGAGTAFAGGGSGFVSAYAPLGSWEESTTGVALILIGGSFPGSLTPAVIPTSGVVNSCSGVPSGTFVAGSMNPEAICVANGNDIYLIDGTSIVRTLTSAGVGESFFSGGLCTTCGVVTDAVSKTAVIAVSTLDGNGGYQLLDLQNPVAAGSDKFPGALVRGGHFDFGLDAGVFAVDARAEPLDSAGEVGFRCGR